MRRNFIPGHVWFAVTGFRTWTTENLGNLGVRSKVEQFRTSWNGTAGLTGLVDYSSDVSFAGPLAEMTLKPIRFLAALLSLAAASSSHSPRRLQTPAMVSWPGQGWHMSSPRKWCMIHILHSVPMAPGWQLHWDVLWLQRPNMQKEYGGSGEQAPRRKYCVLALPRTIRSVRRSPSQSTRQPWGGSDFVEKSA